LQAVRDRLDRTAPRVPEVMVKIYSSYNGMRQAGRHMDYISRKGALELEDQDGSLLIGRTTSPRSRMSGDMAVSK
jgi:fructose-1,6-bisphosphatase